jgi:uncharacterized protein YbbC (DUF1343 family)
MEERDSSYSIKVVERLVSRQVSRDDRNVFLDVQKRFITEGERPFQAGPLFVSLQGTNLSEGRGTTLPFEQVSS